MRPGEITWVEEYFVRLIDGGGFGGPLVLVALAIAFGVGAAHALAPGHGKGIAAAYLVGSRGRPRHAIALGAVVSGMHTVSVLALGLVLYSVTRVPAGAERLAPYMTLVAGLIVLAVGAGLVVRHARLRRGAGARTGVAHAAGTGHSHAADRGAAHGDPTAGEHGPGHHHHLPEGVSPLSRRGLVLLGMSGGLLPSPSAFLVLATALFIGRAGYGFALVIAFSLGLATTLTLIGLATLRGRDIVVRRAERSPRFARAARALPIVSAVGVLIGGLWLTTVAALQFV
jgi:nickel/cobalt transporter (NicO) family protein